jgi:hypothetical protein
VIWLKLSKKGFLFTVTVFLILTYILLSISVWVKGVEASERAYSEFYKESTVELAIEQITPAKVDNVTNIAMNRALFRLNGHAMDHPLREGQPGDENANIRAALYGLLVNGSAPAALFQDGAGVPEENSSLRAWVSSLNSSLLSIGVYVSSFEVSSFNAWQGDINTVNYSFDMNLNLRDYSNTSGVTRTYHINNAVYINGLVDPALARASRSLADDEHVYRQFFFNKDVYGSPAGVSVQTLAAGRGGQGWVYGQLASASGAMDLVPAASELDMSMRHNYIIVGSFTDIIALTPGVYESFAGFIVTDLPGHPSNCTTRDRSATYYNEEGTFNPLKYEGNDCHASMDRTAGEATSLPFIVAPGFNPLSAPRCPVFTGSSTLLGRCALITNTFLPSEVNGAPASKLDTSASAIYGIESVRDLVMCGYYVQDAAAPSYFQRLLPASYLRNSSLGIETFVIGQYANSTSYDLNSRLDRELFNSSIEGIKVMGLPGCRNYESCADSPTTGIFALSSGMISAYNLGPLACSGTRCG